MKSKKSHINSKSSAKLILLATIFLSLSLCCNSCFLKQDRTTTVYGTITDQNNVSVDSILIVLQGIDGIKYDDLSQMYTDSNGQYEMVLEVRNKYTNVNILLPFSSVHNPKFQKNYKDYLIKKNDENTSNCCTATIGEKTKYDFQLISK